MKNQIRTEPVVTIPAALALVANAVLALLAKASVLPDELVAEAVGVVNGLVVLLGLLLARRQVTPTFRADAAVASADERARHELGRQLAASKARSRQPKRKPQA